MKVLLTGGTGFVGAWSALEIEKAGHNVRFLVRDPAKLAVSAGALGVNTSDYTVGDMTDAAAVRTALEGCDAVLHAAALVSTDPSRADEMLAGNLTGARNVLGQAAGLGLDPIVTVSSVAAIFEPGLEILTADLPPVGGTDGYGQSKAVVEQYARSLQDNGHPVVIVYPGTVLGPAAGSQLGEASDGVDSILRLHMVPGIKAGLLIIDVRDLAKLHGHLMEKGLGPRRFTAGGQWVGVRDLARIITAVSGRRVFHVPTPDALLRLVGRGADKIRPVLPDLFKDFTEAGMQYLTYMPDSDDSPAAEAFGLVWRPVRETLGDSVRDVLIQQQDAARD